MTGHGSATVRGLVLVWVLGACGPAPASGQEPGAPAAPTPTASNTGRLWSVDVGVSSAFDSNIDHSPDGARSVGVGFAGSGRWHNNASRPTLELQYELAAQSYTNSTRWDRISHHAEASWSRRLTARFRFQTVGELSLNGSSEDWELGNQYAVSPRLEYRFSPNRRLRFSTLHRLKRIADDPGRNATNQYAAIEFRQFFDDGRGWVMHVRREANDAAADRYVFNRWTYRSTYEQPIGRDDRLAFQVTYRSKEYPYRRLRRQDGVVQRETYQWYPSVDWTRALGGSVSMVVSSAWDLLHSNDPGRGYREHFTSVSVVRRW